MTTSTQPNDEMACKMNLLRLTSEMHLSFTVVLKNAMPEMIGREGMDLAYSHRRALVHSRLLELGIDLRRIFTYGTRYLAFNSRGDGYGLRTVMLTSPDAHYYARSFAKPGTNQVLPVGHWPEGGQIPTLWHGMIAAPFVREVGSTYTNLADLANQGGHRVVSHPQAIICGPFPDIHNFGISHETGLAGYLYLLRFMHANIPSVDDGNRTPNVIRAIVGQLPIICSMRSQGCLIRLRSTFIPPIEELLKGHIGVLLQLLITRHSSALSLILIRSVLHMSRALFYTPTVPEIILMVRASEFNCHDTRRIRRMKAAILCRLRCYCPPVVIADSIAHNDHLYGAFASLYLYKASKNPVYAFNAATISSNILNKLLQREASEGIPSEMEISLLMSVINWRRFRGIPLIDDF